MAEVITGVKQTRVRVSKEQFIQAALSSKTYAELAEKTGQKLNTVIARYNKFKEEAAANGESLPDMERAKSQRKKASQEDTAEIVRRIRANAGGV